MNSVLPAGVKGEKEMTDHKNPLPPTCPLQRKTSTDQFLLCRLERCGIWDKKRNQCSILSFNDNFQVMNSKLGRIASGIE